MTSRVPNTAFETRKLAALAFYLTGSQVSWGVSQPFEMVSMTEIGRFVAVLVSMAFAAALPALVNAQSSTTASVLAVLRDSILHGGEATRLVNAPVRRYQRPAQQDALPALGALLGLPVPRGEQPPLSCRSAPVDRTAIGMEITVTEFEVIGDSAKVSILRHCQQRQRGRTMNFESEPTWFLHREDGRWVVVQKWMRITARPAVRIQQVG
jgi:hypothetical protein